MYNGNENLVPYIVKFDFKSNFRTNFKLKKISKITKWGVREKQRVSGHYLCPSVLFSCSGERNSILEYCRYVTKLPVPVYSVA